MKLVLQIVSLINLIIIIASFSVNNETQPIYTIDMIENEVASHQEDPNSVRCYGFYGCFPITYPWSSKERAQSVYPFSPTILDVKFPAFTHKTRTSPALINLNDPNTITSININRDHPIYFITHGFLELGNAHWLIRIMNELLNYDNNATVVLVDWRGGSSPPYYQAVANIRVVGAILAHTIFAISIELNLSNLDKIHLIGHSLGTHVSGYAGFHLQRDFGVKIGRITGLDPAKPYFEFTDEIVRLDKSDAKYVDIVHTDSSLFIKNSFGLKQSIGHVDFYPNNGESQPACRNAPLLDLTCNHKNSIDLYVESINTKCPFTTISCGSYEEFTAGKCTKCNNDGNLCIKFGFHSYESYKQTFSIDESENESIESQQYPPSISAYLLTSSSRPFCQFHNKITVKTSNITSKYNSDGDIGHLNITLIGENEKQTDEIELSQKTINFQKETEISFFIANSDVGRSLKSLKVKYFYKMKHFRINKPEIHIDFIQIESMEYGSVVKMCQNRATILESGHEVEFKEDFCGI